MKWTGGVGNPTYGVAAFPASQIGYKLCGKMVLSETYTIGVAEEGGAKLAVNLNAEGGDREYFTDSIGSTARHLASFLNIDLSGSSAWWGYALTPPQSYDTPKDEYILTPHGKMASFRGEYGAWLTFDIGMLTFAGAWTNSITGDFYYGSLGQQTGDRSKVETEYRDYLMDSVLWRVEAQIETSDGEVIYERPYSYLMYYWEEYSGEPQGVDMSDPDIEF